MRLDIDREAARRIIAREVRAEYGKWESLAQYEWKYWPRMTSMRVLDALTKASRRYKEE